MDNQENNVVKMTRNQIRLELIKLIRSVDGVYKFNDIRSNFNKDTKELSVDIYIDISYGKKIPDVSWEVQEQVKSFLSRLQEIKISAINIHIQGVK